MRKGTHIVFEESIIGTGTKYTNTEFNALLGAADFVAIQVYTTNVVNAPTLTVQSEFSCDGQTWITLGTAEITQVPVDEGVYVGTTGYSFVGAANMRYKVSLAGTNPECRIRMHATLRELVTDKSPRSSTDA